MMKLSRLLDRRIERKLSRWVREKRFREVGCGLEELASEFHVTPASISRFVIGKYGCSFARWRTSLRIAEARSLLVTMPSEPFCRIGEMVGIPDKSNFRKLFLAELGMTPREWRERSAQFGISE